MLRLTFAILATLAFGCATPGVLPSPRFGLCSTDSECEGIANPCDRAHDTWECEATLPDSVNL